MCAVTAIPNFSLQDLAAAKRNDPVWSTVIYTIESGDDVTLPKLPVPLSQFNICNEVLSHQVMVHDQNVTQLVTPDSLVPTVLNLIHDVPQAGHPGYDKSLAMARKRH